MTDALPKDLLALEVFREAATIVMLLSLAMLAQKAWKERSACFLWAFATWDIFYYLGLWVAVRWPAAPTTPDVLFLIPVPWISQVWFPVLLSGVTMLAVAASRPRAAGRAPAPAMSTLGRKSLEPAGPPGHARA